MAAMGTASAPTLSRRQVLGIATGGLAAATGAGFFAYNFPTLFTGFAGPWPWQRPGTSRALAAHLLRRAGFAYTPADLDAAQSIPYPDLVDKVLAQRPEPLPDVAFEGRAAAVVRAWYQHMATTASQFPERMLLFWHGVLTSDYHSAGVLPFALQQNRLYRDLGRGSFRTLLLAVTFDPLMMRYLNLAQSSAAAPNENYSRELMELFTLGPGNYTETDVRQGARALSGIRTVLVDASGSRIRLAPRKGTSASAYAAYIANLLAQGARFTSVLVPRNHDSGVKTFLGRTGNLGPEEVVDAILAQPACATHVATRALQHFCMPTPPAALVNTVANAFRGSGYDITAMMRAIFTSDDFVSATAYRSLVRSPAHLIVATMRVLGRPDLAPAAARAGVSMGQALYDPPNVGGWPVSTGWVSSSAWLARLNFIARATMAQHTFPDASQAVRDQLDGVVSDATSAVLHAAQSDEQRWYALLAGPEFQLQ